MRNAIGLSLIPVLIVLTFSSLFAVGRGHSMGGVSSVVSDGPFDAVRNPALLTLQTDENALGIYAKYLAYDRTQITFDASFHDINPQVDVATQDRSGMALLIAYAHRLGNTVLGFAIVDDDECQIFSSKTKTEIEATIPSLGTYNISGEEKTEGYNPHLSASLGFNLSKNSALGFQFSFKYKEKDITSDELTKANGTVVERIEKEQKLTTYAFTAVVGYLFRDKDSQLGFGFDIGEFTWQDQDYDYHYRDLDYASEMTPIDNSFTGSESYSFGPKYTRGFGFVGGGYQRLSSLFAIALEGEFRIGSSYKVTSLDIYSNTENDDEYHEIVKSRTSLVNRNSVFLKGGVEINPYPAISIMFGGGYIFYLGRSRGVNTEAEGVSENNIYLFTCGAIYQIGKDISISVVAVVTQLDGESKQRAKDESSSEEYSLELDQETTSALLFAGAVYSF
jgi:hypothetical protein